MAVMLKENALVNKIGSEKFVQESVYRRVKLCRTNEELNLLYWKLDQPYRLICTEVK